MMIEILDKYLVIDLEATCCDDLSIPREDMETIQIGAALTDRRGKLIETLSLYVRPQVHPHLTEFCTRLTGISQDSVDSAELFPEAMLSLMLWLRHHNVSNASQFIWYSWGKFDRHQLAMDCERHHIENHFWSNHRNLARYVSKITGHRGRERAMTHLGIVFEGRRHDGLSDAVNAAKFIPFLIAT